MSEHMEIKPGVILNVKGKTTPYFVVVQTNIEPGTGEKQIQGIPIGLDDAGNKKAVSMIGSIHEDAIRFVDDEDEEEGEEDDMFMKLDEIVSLYDEYMQSKGAPALSDKDKEALTRDYTQSTPILISRPRH